MTIEKSYRCGIITVSDRSASGVRADLSGPAIREALSAVFETHQFEIAEMCIVPDETNSISASIRSFAKCCDVVFTTGGTGFAARDITPEATTTVIERPAPGISEYLRWSAYQTNPRAALSRGTAGIVGKSLVINLPGSPNACRESILAIGPFLVHALQILRNDPADH